MSDEIDKEIDTYLRGVRKALPDDLHTEDLIEDLREHIMEALASKADSRPHDDRHRLLAEVISELGDPETISREYRQTTMLADQDEKEGNRLAREAAKWLFKVMVIVLAAWLVSNIESISIDFWLAFVTLLVLAIAEYFVREWQSGMAAHN
ncbi:MAG: hypothetical protein HXY34_08935 [Candidatus Thorarchaeota archaeon]|nr:hypothetical protein [Candidatus Thorarchaeota archaeon]